MADAADAMDRVPPQRSKGKKIGGGGPRPSQLTVYPQSPPLPPGEGWGEGKRTSESIEKTGSDLRHSHP